MATSDNTRKCKNCKESYPLTTEYFPANGKLADGTPLFRGVCRECWRKRERDYHATPEAKEAKRQSRKRRDPEIVKAEKARSQKKHPESNKRRIERFIANHPDYRKEQHLKHRDRNVSRAIDWNKKNADRFNARLRKARQNNPEMKIKEGIRRHERRARLKAAEGTYTQEDIHRIYDEQEGRCAYCGISIYWSIPYDTHIDHIKPLAKGGTNWPDNLACTCAECNLSKGDRMLDEWMQSRGW